MHWMPPKNKAFEAAIIADCDAQSAVERELVLRLASLLWRLRPQWKQDCLKFRADHLGGFTQASQVRPGSREVVYVLFGRSYSGSFDPDPASQGRAYETEDVPDSIRKSHKTCANPGIELTRCFLRLTNLPTPRPPQPI